jgi:hypothetical protein
MRRKTMPETTKNENPITPFAVTDYRDIRKRFGIKDKNRRAHMHVIGKTGTGKSTLLLNMIVSDMRGENGVGLIDPAGDLAEGLLDFVPKERIEDVIYFNPGDQECPIGFNPLENVDPDRKHLLASGLISSLKHAFPEFWGPRLEYILRNALLALLDHPGNTLLDIPPLLTDKDVRQRVVEGVKNPEVRRFWLSEFEKYSAWLKNEATSPILNKVGPYLSTPLIRNIVGQAKSGFRMREVMDNKKILIVNLSKGRIGEDNCALLGAMIMAQVQLAALSRSRVPEKDRVPFYLYADEFYNFTTLSFADALAEARKYGLSLTLAHQYLGQLDEKIREAVFGNVGTLISFRIGQEDAKALAREFYPVFNEEDLVNLANYHICLKLMIDGITSQAFSAITLPQPECPESYRDEAIRASQNTYSRPRAQVEREICLQINRSSSPAKKPYAQQSLPF